MLVEVVCSVDKFHAMAMLQKTDKSTKLTNQQNLKTETLGLECAMCVHSIHLIPLPSHTDVVTYGLCTLPDTDLDPNPGTDLRPKNRYSSDWGSESK